MWTKTKIIKALSHLPVTVTGRGKQWEVYCPDDATMDAVEAIIGPCGGHSSQCKEWWLTPLVSGGPKEDPADDSTAVWGRTHY